METVVYKLTDQNMQTYNGFQWVIGVPAPELSGEGGLCGPGHYYAYTDPLLAVLLNPVHTDIEHPRLFRAVASEISGQDHGLKVGVKTMTLLEELPVLEVATMHRVKFVILIAKKVCVDQKWNAWVDAWLSGKDRSSLSAWAVWKAALAARREAKAWKMDAASTTASAWAAWAAWAVVANTGWGESELVNALARASEEAAEAVLESAAALRIDLISIAREACLDAC